MEPYPNKDIKKVLPYHYAPSGGSRPVKVTVDRKGMLKHKKCKQMLYKAQTQQHISRDDVF